MAGKVKFSFDPTSDPPSCALYRDPNDDRAPLTDPLNHLEDVIFHPALRYCGIVDVITGTLSLAASPTLPADGLRSHTLAAHGQSGRPMMFGVIKSHPLAGVDVAWMGSVPVQQMSSGNPSAVGCHYVRWLTLGADDTNILAYEFCPHTILGFTLGSTSIDYEIYILDIDLDAALPSGDEIRLTNADGFLRIDTPNGVFSMDRRYLKKKTPGGLVIPGGKTISTRWKASGDSNPGSSTWRCWHGSGGDLDMGAYRAIYESGDYLPPSFTPTVEPVDF